MFIVPKAQGICRCAKFKQYNALVRESDPTLIVPVTSCRYLGALLKMFRSNPKVFQGKMVELDNPSMARN